MCYGSDCKWEIQYGENAGECRKPSRFPCPMDEDYEDDDDEDDRDYDDEDDDRY